MKRAIFLATIVAIAAAVIAARGDRGANPIRTSTAHSRSHPAPSTTELSVTVFGGRDASELPVHCGDRRATRRRSYRVTGKGHAAATGEARRLALLVDAATTVGLLTGRTHQGGS